MGMLENFERKYSKYFVKLPDKAPYLNRIGLGGDSIPLTKEGLDRLQLAHLCTVPFENIDLFDYGMDVDYGIEEQYDKVVTRRRGGYCFELNSIFMALLEAVGFEVYPAGVRIIIPGMSFIPPISHRATIVTIDGKRYYADVGVGFANAPRISICIDDYSEQDIHGETYTVEDRPYNHKMIMRHVDGEPTELFLFAAEPYNVLDFTAYNNTIQSGFRFKRIAILHTPAGSISIDGGVFRRSENGVRAETVLSGADDAHRALTGEFGMILERPLRDYAVSPEFSYP